MRSNTRMYFSVVLVAALVGCGGSDDSESGQEASDQAALGKPEDAVGEFLEAYLVGDDQTVAQMLTPLARQEVAKADLTVAPQGSDTATFSVGEVEYLAENGARVAATLTDLDENGKPKTEEMTWMVRRGPEGWRVAGMATIVFPGEPPLLLDFERPQEFLHKLELVGQEIRRREQTAGLPSTESRISDESIRR